LLDLLTELDRTPAPHGRERLAAVRLLAWCEQNVPAVDWRVQEYGEQGANLIGSFGRAPGHRLLYSHLDTSLDGSSADQAVTGRSDPIGPLRIEDDGSIEGFGLGVARGPAAAALLGFAAAAAPDSTLLLAGSGTHRLIPGETTGVRAYLDTHPHPEQAVVAKAGPPGVLHSEPGAAYLSIRVTGRSGAVLARRRHRPDGGLLAQAGPVLTAVEHWCNRYVADRPGVGQIGAEAGIGRVNSGLATKPDLIPGILDIGVYLVTLPDEDVPALAADLTRALAAVRPDDCAVAVVADQIHPAATTAPDAPVVRQAQAVRARHLGPHQPITGWTGSTDGVVLRGAGVDTVRLGPTIGQGRHDPRHDRTTLKTLLTWAQIYTELLVDRS